MGLLDFADEPILCVGMESVTALLRRLIRVVVFERLSVSLAIGFAGSQLFLAAWLWTVLGAQPAGPLSVWITLAALLVAAHLAALHASGSESRLLRYSFRPTAQAYVSTAFSLVVVAVAVGTAAGAFAGVAVILGWAGPDEGLAFTLVQVSTGVAALAAASSVANGFAAARRPPAARGVRVEIAGLPAELRGIRVAHISDLHIGNGYAPVQIQALVERINSLETDIIALTGDIFDRDPSVVAPAAAILARLRARYGVFAVLGNHDAYVGKDLVADALRAHAPGIRLLRGDFATTPTVPPLYIAGIDDPGDEWRVTPEGARDLDLLARKRGDRSPCVLLVHRPDVFPVAATEGFALVLSGHYHGGQIALPGTSGAANAARLISPYYAGLHRIGASTLHVTRGIGCAGPRLRIACPPEISILELG